MKRNALGLLSASVVLSMAVPALAAHGRRPGEHGSGSQSPRSGVHRRDGHHDRARDRRRDCTGATDRVRRRARDMAEAAGRSGFGPAQAGVHRQRLLREFQNLEREHGRYLENLGPAERTRLQDRLREVERLRLSARERLRLMDVECARAQPDRVRLREHARELESEMERWRDQYRGGAEPEGGNR
jgi:hypothetical protein